ncbi:Importin subunit alpha-1 [Blattella germanica]|nr:Importin subunit alpha-1 [Blattella germanica]
MPSQENERPNRLTSFKNKGKNADEMRRRRNEVSVELRKARKDDQLLKRRNLNSEDDSSLPLQENNSQSAVSMTIEEIILGMDSADGTVQLNATQAARKTLSREKNPPIDAMIEAGIVPKCVEFLSRFDNPSLQFEASWALTNIASGTSEQTNTVVKFGAVPKLVELLRSRYMHVAEQAVWALGNIAGDGPVARDLVLNYGAMPPLLELVKPDTATDAIIQAGGLPYLKELLKHPRVNIMKEAAWTLSNITAGNVEQIQEVIDNGLMEPLLHVLLSGDFKSQKEAAWAVTNFTSGGSVQQLAVLVQMGFLKPFCDLMDSRDWKAVTVAAEKMGEVERLALMIEECNGLDKLEQLQNHENETVYQKALNLIDKYFSEAEAEDSSLAPGESNGQLDFSNTNSVPDGGFSF